jgi:ABC-2 type transport system permease protein
LAVQKRSVLFTAKTALIAVVSLIVTEILSIASFLLSYLLASPTIKDNISFGQAFEKGAEAGLLRGPLSILLIVLFASGIGWIIKNSAGSISAFFGFYWVLPLLVSIIAALSSKAKWIVVLYDTFPSSLTNVAASASTNTSGISTGLLSTTYTPNQALLLLFAWAVVLLTSGFVLFKKRDI